MPNDKKSKKSSKRSLKESDKQTKTSSAQKESKIFKKNEILRIYTQEKKRTLIIDVVALISLCIVYSAYLIYTEDILGNFFLVFASICCILIFIDYTSDNRAEKKAVEEDLEILFK
jgi:hypothetical protein